MWGIFTELSDHPSEIRVFYDLPFALEWLDLENLPQSVLYLLGADFEYGSAVRVFALVGTAGVGGSEAVACWVEDHAGCGDRAVVVRTAETVKYAFLPTAAGKRRQSKNSAAAVVARPRTASVGRAVQVARFVKGESAQGKSPVRCRATEDVEDGCAPAAGTGAEFINGSAAIMRTIVGCWAAVFGGAVQILLRIHGEAVGKVRASGTNSEIVENVFGPSTASTQGQLEDRAAAGIAGVVNAGSAAAFGGCTVQISRPIEN